MSDNRRIPLSTYRLQFNRDFSFADATALVPYFERLGISHCYASPYLKARAGSSHGYDIVDHNALNPEIGDAESFDRFVDTLSRYGMGHILDLVPNHMGVFGDDNRWWLDVLENGPASNYAIFFDIDWRPAKEVLRGKVLVPVLGDHYGRVLEEGDLTLAFDPERGEFSVRYWEHRLPIDPGTYPTVLEYGLDDFLARHDTEDPDIQDLRTLIGSFGHLPARWETAADRVAERDRDKEVHKRHLASLCNRSPAVSEHITHNLARFNGATEGASDFSLLHALLERQAYRLAYWQVASDEINYRRFFDINDLAGLRMEEPAVFEETHRLVLQLLADGKLDGLRIDHPDGLYDPAGYYHRLQQRACGELDQPGPANPGEPPPFYLVVEKILASHEHLPPTWPVHGTTGYEFANLVSGLLVYPGSEAELTRTYQRFTGVRTDFDALLYERKRLTIETQLSSELTVLSNLLDQIAQLNPQTRDFTLNGLRAALTTVVASFPVYRTYINGHRPLPEEDRRYVEWAIALAKKRSPAGDVSTFDFIRDILLGEGVAETNEEIRRQAIVVAMKFQQYTAPVMAKGLEDNALYIYNRLVSLNEVGGDPRRYAVTVSAFHRLCQERLQSWPHNLLATSTHDTKRSEDVRARIGVISEVPAEWQRNVGRWTRLNRAKKVEVDGVPAPARNDEYLLYQTLVGTWPLAPPDPAALGEYRDRIRNYLLKTVREAKLHTSWINPNDEYEAAVSHFVDTLLAEGQNRFLTDFVSFAGEVTRFGLFNALSQVVLKLTAPGVPDVYQGNELWDFSLVDPDNRRPVDYAERQRLLDEIAAREPAPGFARDLMENLYDGRIKLHVTHRLLRLRREHPALFARGDYQPIAAEGNRADHLCAFSRSGDEAALVVVTARWFARLLTDSDYPVGEAAWGDTRLLWPQVLAGRWRDVLTGENIVAEGETVAATDLYRCFPAVVLLRET